MKISVFITSYNQKKYLIEAIESVLAQSLKPFQIVIVDDASNDGSHEVIEGYRSRYPQLIVPIYHKTNSGVAQARIDALNAVKGDYVTYVDGDDRFLPDKLEKESRVLKENPHAKIAFSNNFYMNEEGKHTGVWADSAKPPEGYVFCQTFARDFPRRSLFRMELVDYDAWRSIGFHDPYLDLYEDFDMRIRLTKKYKVVYYDEPLSEIRLHDRGLSKAETPKHIESVEYIYKKNSNLLEDLSTDKKRYVEKMFYAWVADLSKKAAEQSLKQNNSMDTLKNYFKSILFK